MATNEEIVIKAAMAILGSRTSAAKKRSSRLNGMKRKLKPREKKSQSKWATRYSDLRVAIRRGDVKRQPCSVCGASKVVAHHEDYAKPLDIVWLCKKHHMARHKAIRMPKSENATK